MSIEIESESLMAFSYAKSHYFFKKTHRKYVFLRSRKVISFKQCIHCSVKFLFFQLVQLLSKSVRIYFCFLIRWSKATHLHMHIFIHAPSAIKTYQKTIRYICCGPEWAFPRIKLQTLMLLTSYRKVGRRDVYSRLEIKIPAFSNQTINKELTC